MRNVKSAMISLLTLKLTLGGSTMSKSMDKGKKDAKKKPAKSAKEKKEAKKLKKAAKASF
jgi:hypothetical protein